jgi:heptaprenyl diphosphate synthase
MKKSVANFGVLSALAFIFSYIEVLIPFNFGIPGVKLGLANIVIVVALYLMGIKKALLLSVIRIILVGFTFGNLYSLLYSLAGGVLSFAVMVIGKKMKCFSIIGISVLGGTFHNIGQIIVAAYVVKTIGLAFYIPILVIAGVATGIIIGTLANILVKRIKIMTSL